MVSKKAKSLIKQIKEGKQDCDFPEDLGLD